MAGSLSQGPYFPESPPMLFLPPAVNTAALFLEPSAFMAATVSLPLLFPTLLRARAVERGVDTELNANSEVPENSLISSLGSTVAKLGMGLE